MDAYLIYRYLRGRAESDSDDSQASEVTVSSESSVEQVQPATAAEIVTVEETDEEAENEVPSVQVQLPQPQPQPSPQSPPGFQQQATSSRDVLSNPQPQQPTTSSSRNVSSNPQPQQPTTSSSEDVLSNPQSQHPSTSSGDVLSKPQTIRELVAQAKCLLLLAETTSRPEQGRRDPGSGFRYNFSSRVTGSDLFREQELRDLIDTVSVLKHRLSAERVFSLGCPQLAQERDVFDVLLLRYSEEVLSETRALGQPSGSSGGRAGTSSHQTHSSTAGSSLSQLDGVDTNRSAPSDSASLQEPESSDGSEAETQPTGSQDPPASVLLPAIDEFISGTAELTQLGCSETESLAQRMSDPAIIKILKSLYKSLDNIVGRSGSGEEEPSASPAKKKRKRSQEQDSFRVKKPKTEPEEQAKDEEEDASENCCSICLEPWSTGGDHKITSLKCGHLFGLSCITKWVDQDHSCPQCKAKAKKCEFRSLFVKNITAEDTSQRDRAILLLELEKESRRKLEQSEANLRRKLEIRTQDHELMRQELARCRAELATESGETAPATSTALTVQPSTSSSSSSGGGTSSASGSQPSSLKKFHVFQRIYISQEGQCRVFDCSKDLGMTVVSQKSANPLFKGYGIKMLSRDFRPLSYQPLHSGAIRDMSFRPDSLDGMLLSCGLDKTVLLSSVTSKAVIQKYSLNTTVWCCAWNTHDTNLFYAGMERGVVREFDIRRTSAHVRDVMDSGGSPITNLQFWRGLDTQGNFFQGLLIAQLQNLVFKQQVRNNFTNYVLPQMKAPVMSLSLHSSGKFLSSFRPGTSLPKCRYEISDIRMTDDEQQKVVTSRLHAMFDGGRVQAVISRNCLLTRPETEEGLLAVTANHANNTVNVWDFDQRTHFQTLPCFEKAIDIKPVVPSTASGNFLGVLTDKDLVLFKWRE